MKTREKSIDELVEIKKQSHDKEKYHECKYCGVMTKQSDDECYANPIKEINT